MGKSRKTTDILITNEDGIMFGGVSEEFLDKVDEGLFNYVDHEDMSFMDNDEITDYIDKQMTLSSHQFTRSDKLKHFPDLEEGDEIEFNSYYTSFSESMDSTIEYAYKMGNTNQHIIFRTNGPVNDFDMYDYTPSEYTWQEEHLLWGYPKGNPWVIDKITDVSTNPQYSSLIQDDESQVLLVDISTKK